MAFSFSLKGGTDVRKSLSRRKRTERKQERSQVRVRAKVTSACFNGADKRQERMKTEKIISRPSPSQLTRLWPVCEHRSLHQSNLQLDSMERSDHWGPVSQSGSQSGSQLLSFTHTQINPNTHRVKVWKESHRWRRCLHRKGQEWFHHHWGTGGTN